jgi:hypothetical protein
MTNLQRRLRKLEAQLTDSCGLVPHSQKWLEYWEQRIYRMFTGEEPGTPGSIPLEAFDAVRDYTEEHRSSLMNQVELRDESCQSTQIGVSYR